MVNHTVDLVIQFGLMIVLAAGLFVAMLAIVHYLMPSSRNPNKGIPYECGVVPESDARIPYNVHYYLVAVLFVLFDLEAVFIYPWALTLRSLGLAGRGRDVRLRLHPARRLRLRLEKRGALVGMTDPKGLPADPAALLKNPTRAELQEALGEDDRLPGVVPVSLDKLLNFGASFSYWPLLFGLACCAIEMMATAGPRWDISRFGMEAMRASPRQADGMIVAGWVSLKMAPRVIRLYEQIPDPKWVIVMGSCATSGNIWDTYNIVQGVDALLPVDVYVPGCPPRPEALWQGLEMIRVRVKQGRHALRPHAHHPGQGGDRRVDRDPSKRLPSGRTRVREGEG